MLPAAARRQINSTDARCTPPLLLLPEEASPSLLSSKSGPYGSLPWPLLEHRREAFVDHERFQFSLGALVVACNDVGLVMATAHVRRGDFGRRYTAAALSLPFVLSCAGMRSPGLPKLPSPCYAHDGKRDYRDLSALEIQTF